MHRGKRSIAGAAAALTPVVLVRWLRYQGDMAAYLVTGATGFVGHALTLRLLGEPGAEVRALVRDPARVSALPKGVDARVSSLGDPNAIAEAARGVDVLYHCAGENDARAARRAFSWVNVAGTENVVNAARHAGVRRVVHLSCADVTLVNRDRLSWRETSAMTEAPLDACARSKLLAEELALQASDRALEVCALRPAWVWGPGELRTLPALCEEAAQRGRVRLCGDGKNLVPTVYIDNLVDALLLAARAPNAPGHAYHILDGEVLDASELLGKLCGALGLGAPVRGIYGLSYAAARVREAFGLKGLLPCDVVRRGRSCLFDGMAAARDLGYEPKTGVDAGMQALAAWVTELGGPTGLALRRRKPTTDADVDALVRLSEASEPAA